jgi:hypothetical protein
MSGSARARHAEERVQVGAAEVEVDHRHALAGGGQRQRQIRGDDRLADAALAATHGEDAGRRLGLRRRERARGGRLDPPQLLADGHRLHALHLTV